MGNDTIHSFHFPQQQDKTKNLISYYVTILFSALTRMFPKPTFAP